jgi:hypothetical protein
MNKVTHVALFVAGSGAGLLLAKLLPAALGWWALGAGLAVAGLSYYLSEHPPKGVTL